GWHCRSRRPDRSGDCGAQSPSDPGLAGTSIACARSASMGTMSSARSCVDARTTYAAAPSRCAEPVHRRHAPPVARLQPGEHELRHRGDQVIADPPLVLEELGSDHRADRVASEVLRPRVAAAVAVEPRDRVVAARLKLSAENVPLAHQISIALANPRPVRGHYVPMSDEQDRGAMLRAKMVERLAKERGLSDPRVSAAMLQVPRHVFLPRVDLAEAYADNAVVTRYRDGL